MQRKFVVLALLALGLSSTGFAADLPKATHKLNNLDVIQEVGSSGSKWYWLVGKSKYQANINAVNLTQIREDKFGKLSEAWTYDAPCDHRKFVQLETTVDNPFGPAPKTTEWWSSKKLFGHTEVSLKITDALCPKK